jgi:hypothetical protein
MSYFQSLPGLLNVNEVLNRIATQTTQTTLQSDIKVLGWSTKHKNKSQDLPQKYCKFTLMDAYDLESLEAQLHEKFLSRVHVSLIELHIFNDGSHKLVDIREKKYRNFSRTIGSITIFKTMKNLRDLLSAGKLDAYIQYHYEYHKIPSGFWHYDANWYRLLADHYAYGNILSQENVLGGVYFKEENVNRCLSPTNQVQQNCMTQCATLINLDMYTTPWLQVLEAVYHEYGKEQLACVSKTSIESFIHDYITQRELDISSSDIPFLAKFIRLAEQKEGKKYHVKKRQQEDSVAHSLLKESYS